MNAGDAGPRAIAASPTRPPCEAIAPRLPYRIEKIAPSRSPSIVLLESPSIRVTTTPPSSANRKSRGGAGESAGVRGEAEDEDEDAPLAFAAGLAPESRPPAAGGDEADEPSASGDSL